MWSGMRSGSYASASARRATSPQCAAERACVTIAAKRNGRTTTRYRKRIGAGRYCRRDRARAFHQGAVRGLDTKLDRGLRAGEREHGTVDAPRCGGEGSRSSSDRTAVGMIWVQSGRTPGRSFIFNLEIFEPYRRKVFAVQ